MRKVTIGAVALLTGVLAVCAARSSWSAGRLEAPAAPESVAEMGSAAMIVGSSPASIALAPVVDATVTVPPTAGETAPAAASTRTVDTLITALGSNDPYVVLDAADGLAARKATRAIPVLAAMDIRKEPDSAPSVIDALGRLASVADAALRKTATERLVDLLAQEKSRRAPESLGNILALYEALGHTHDARAAAPLEAELHDVNVTLAAKTVVVAALTELAQPTSRAALRTLRQQLAGMTLPDALEEEIRQELAAAVDAALVAMP